MSATNCSAPKNPPDAAKLPSANRRHMAAWVELARRGGLDVGLAE